MNENKYYIETYGCQMNVYDSELVASLLKKTGYSETKQIESADVIFLNTCAIREKAEETVHNRLDSLHFLKKEKSKSSFRGSWMYGQKSKRWNFGKPSICRCCIGP